MSDHAEAAAGPPEVTEKFYQPKDAVSVTLQDALAVGGAGLFLSTIQNTLARKNVGAFGIFTRFGRTTAVTAAAGGVYGFVSTASANLRQYDDFWNHAWGGAATGAVLGFARGRGFPAVLGTGVFAGVILATVSFTGGAIFALGATPEERIETKLEHRRRFRRPFQEMINEIGEGRGIYPEGYDERRALRLKQNYGIEVQPPYYERKRALGLEPGAVI